MARLLEVSRSGFYAWAARQAGQPGPQRRAREDVNATIPKVFPESAQVYGALRGHAELAREGTMFIARPWWH